MVSVVLPALLVCQYICVVLTVSMVSAVLYVLSVWSLLRHLYSVWSAECSVSQTRGVVWPPTRLTLRPAGYPLTAKTRLVTRPALPAAPGIRASTATAYTAYTAGNLALLRGASFIIIHQFTTVHFQKFAKIGIFKETVHLQRVL